MSLAVVLGLGILGLFLVVGAVVLIVITIAAILKMRKDEFWDEPMS
jgi:hypothetical protein